MEENVFSKSIWRWWKTNNFIVCIDRLFKDICNRKQFDAYLPFSDQTVNCLEKAYLGPSFLGHGGAETVSEKKKETLRNLDYCYLGLLTKSKFFRGNLKNVLKITFICHKEMFVWSEDIP